MRVFVLDASVAVEYPDIIPDGKEASVFDNASIDLTTAHIVIPEHTVFKLSLLKKKGGETGQAASEALSRINALFSDGVVVTVGEQTFATQRFSNKEHIDIPFVMDANDLDAWIIGSVIALKESEKIVDVFGSTLNTKEAKEPVDITLLTNDDAMSIRAKTYGINVSKYFRKVYRYTGRRDLTVPKFIFESLWYDHEIPVEVWQYYIPNEPELIANEFIVMYPDEIDPKIESAIDREDCFDYIGRYDADKRSIVGLNYVKNFPTRVLNAGQAIYAEALLNPDFDAVICTGPAGTGKTYLATIYAIESCKAGEFLRGVVVPCSPRRNNLGALPGGLDEKLDPNVQPIKNAVRNWLLNTNKSYRREFDNLRKYGPGRSKNGDEINGVSLIERLDQDVENKFRRTFGDPIPIEYARGRDFSFSVAIYDEFQDQDLEESTTLIERLGKDGKMIITGDVKQIHAKDKGLDEAHNGIVYAKKACINNPAVALVDLHQNEIVRHDLVREIVRRQQEPANEAAMVG